MAQHQQQQQQQQQQHSSSSADRKRVKVYELKNNDWYDRGTGFCTGHTVTSPNATPENPDARIVVVSEDDSHRTLLETRITRDDGYQKQQDTLIVWTESNGVDMALSFQEADGCASIWEFVSDMQARLAALAPDDGLSDDLLDSVHPIVLPEPQLGKLDEIENTIRVASSTPAGRDALVKFVMHPDQMYIMRLAPLVDAAEAMESTADLHRLCNIMKHLILLNDTAIIEFVVTDRAIMGVVGALEYDPDFPSHRANHRQYLSDSSKFKEVVPIREEEIKRKIHWTYRLLYLKDVVLARILDDPTFSVLNSLIFFHQVDIVNHLQAHEKFLGELFAIFHSGDGERHEKKKEAVQFIQNCCAVSKNTQPQSRAQLYQNFINHGLFSVITFALRHHDASVRVAGTDVLVALIDHDPQMVRNHIFTSVKEKTVPLTDTLIELLLVEVDLGVKSQMADAIKILLDPSSNQPHAEMMMARNFASSDMIAKQRGQHAAQQPQTNQFIDAFYDASAKRLFAPLKALENRPTMSNLTTQETSLFTHLVDVLCFFVRQHSYRGKLFILGENLHGRVAQLLSCPQKYMKLIALKWFRTCVGLQDEFHNRQMMQSCLFDPILSIVEATMPRDNLLNSACLELFEYIRRENVRQLVSHLVGQYRDRLMSISYVNTFQDLILRYDQMMAGYHPSTNGDDSTLTTQEGTPARNVNGRLSFAGLKERDSEEEAYFNTDADSDDEEEALPKFPHPVSNGSASSAGLAPLVPYLEDDDEENEAPNDLLGSDILASSPDPLHASKPDSSSPHSSSTDKQRTLTATSSDSTTAPTSDDPSPFYTIAPSDDMMEISTPDPDHIQPHAHPQIPSGASADGIGPHDPLTADDSQTPATSTTATSQPLREISNRSPTPIKRRRPHDEDDDDDDALDKMMGSGAMGAKRRNSSVAGSVKGSESESEGSSVNGRTLRRKGGFAKMREQGGGNGGGTMSRVAIKLGGAVKSPDRSGEPLTPAKKEAKCRESIEKEAEMQGLEDSPLGVGQAEKMAQERKDGDEGDAPPKSKLDTACENVAASTASDPAAKASSTEAIALEPGDGTDAPQS